MNVVPLNTGICDRILRLMDSYISGELMVETNHEVLNHLSQCDKCAREHQLRQMVRHRLRDAVQTQEVPSDLQSLIQNRLRGQRTKRASFRPQLMLLPYAALLLLGVFGAWYALRGPKALSDLDDASQFAFIERVSVHLPAILRVGFGDHLHCSVARKYPQAYPKPAEVTAQAGEKLGPEFSSLLPIVRALVPEKYQLILAHRCGFKQRRFVHFTFRGEEKLISLVIARKAASETFDAASLLPQLRAAGIPVYQRAVENYQVAGFESRDYLAYLVSDLDAGANASMTAALAPAVREYLDKLSL